MEKTGKPQAFEQHRSPAEAERRIMTPLAVEFVDNRPEAVDQRKLDGIDHSPHVTAQRALSTRIHRSPQMVAQRTQSQYMLQKTVQRMREKGPLNSQRARSLPAGPRIAQRSILPVEQPNEGNEGRTVQGYIDLLEYRKARQEWGESDKRTLVFQQMKTEAEKRRWKEAFESLKQLEALVAEGDKTADTARGPVVLQPEQQLLIRETAKADFNAAHDLLINLAHNQEVLEAVFGTDKFDVLEARLNMIAIGLQLLNYVLHDNILTDDDGKAEASGSLAHNVERGAGSKAKLMLTFAYAKAPQHERLGTLIHEASHGSAITATADIVYLRSWAGMAVRGQVALMNADSYKKAALLAQGQGAALKPLKGGEVHKDRLEQLLGWTDFRISQARSMASRLRQRAVVLKGGVESFRNVKESEPDLYALSKALKLPWQEGRDPASRFERFGKYDIRNIDLDLMDMFVNAFSVALGYLDLIDELDIRTNDQPGLVYGKKLLVTTGALTQMTNARMGVYLASQIGEELPIPKHWKDVFDSLVVELSTKRIQEEGQSLKALDVALS